MKITPATLLLIASFDVPSTSTSPLLQILARARVAPLALTAVEEYKKKKVHCVRLSNSPANPRLLSATYAVGFFSALIGFTYLFGQIDGIFGLAAFVAVIASALASFICFPYFPVPQRPVLSTIAAILLTFSGTIFGTLLELFCQPPHKRWQSRTLESFGGDIPPRVREKIARIRELEPSTNFMIEELLVRDWVVDPLISAQLGTETIYFDVWDEKDLLS